MAYIKTEGLSFSYPQSSERALDNINIEIKQGELVLVMGRTGSGKSTLLKLLNKILAPNGTQSGAVINDFEGSAFVVQNPDNSFVSQSVRGELVFALENQGLPNDRIAVRLGEIASFFNLGDMLDCNISSLSGGERAVVAIASAMINDAPVLILDEPLAQLDTKAAGDVISLIKRVNSELGTTVIISSHKSDGIVDACDRLVVLDNGRVIFDDTPAKINTQPEILSFMPVYTSLFDERPLTVKEAIALDRSFKEKEIALKTFDETAVSVNGITFAYDKRGRDILDNLSLDVYKGSVHSIIGANGSGKTTLLKVMAGIKKQYSGKVKAYGRLAYLPQNPEYLFTCDTVLEETGEDFAKKICGADWQTRHPYDLSGGEKQRLALEILYRQGFDIILMDEPARSLDFYYKRELKDYIKSLIAKGKTVVIVSHDLDFVGDISDTVSFLSDGIITITGDRRTVLSSLDFYTTQIRRITKSRLASAVSVEDLE